MRASPSTRWVDKAEAEGCEILGARWVDVNKGDNVGAQVRSRACAKELKWKNPRMEDAFAGAPPWEGIRMMRTESGYGTVWSWSEREIQGQEDLHL